MIILSIPNHTSASRPHKGHGPCQFEPALNGRNVKQTALCCADEEHVKARKSKVHQPDRVDVVRNTSPHLTHSGAPFSQKAPLPGGDEQMVGPRLGSLEGTCPDREKRECCITPYVWVLWWYQANSSCKRTSWILHFSVCERHTLSRNVQLLSFVVTALVTYGDGSMGSRLKLGEVFGLNIGVTQDGVS